MLNRYWPAIAVRDRLHCRHHMVLWALRGEAHAECGGERFDFTRGQALVIPAGLPHQLAVPPEAIVLPLMVPDLGTVKLPARGLVLSLGPEWDDWMLHHFSAWVSPMRSPGYSTDQVIATVGRAGDGAASSLPMPATGAARDVAIGLQRDPARPLTAQEWADRVGVSVRTLRRLFLSETGLTFAQWRTACRTGAAADLLLTGATVEWVAGQVGFATATGLIRAFSRRFGQTPDSWRKQYARGVGPEDNPRMLLARQCSTMLDAAVGARVPGNAATAPAVPATVATRRCFHGTHVLLWAYRGRAHVKIDDANHVLRQGWAVWMPAGRDHTVHVDPGAVALPLSFTVEQIPPAQVTTGPFHISANRRELLLKHVIANLTAVRPAGYRRMAALDCIREPDADRVPDVRVPTTASAAKVATALLRNPADRRTTADWAGRVAMSAGELDRCFREEAGLPLRAWTAHMRMVAARDMVADGVVPKVVARRLGYKHLSGFSCDFARQHGMPPREYQREQQRAA